jgi:hypothetical protein
MYDELQQKAQYPLRKDLFDWIARPLGDNLFLLSQEWRYPEFWEFFWISVVTTLPSTLYILRIALDTLSRNRESVLLRIAAVIAGLVPISLNMMAGDLNRWNSLPTITSFLVLFIVTFSLPVPQQTQTESEHSFAVPGIIIVMTLGSTIPLFDGYVVQSFPFQEHVHSVIDMIKGRAPFPPRPELCSGTARC